MISWEQSPTRNPISSSDLLWAFKYNRDVATKPVNSVKRLMPRVMFTSKWMLSPIININMLPMPSKCMLVLNFKNNKMSAVAVAVKSPVKK
jgi:hypothetical protein